MNFIKQQNTVAENQTASCSMNKRYSCAEHVKVINFAIKAYNLIAKRIARSFYMFWEKNKKRLQIQAFFISKASFPTQPQCRLAFSWIELQMLLNCCLIPKIIFMLGHILYLVYLCLKQPDLFFVHFLE